MQRRDPEIHFLKLDEPYFTEVSNWNKMFEVRYNDRDFQVGDELILKQCVDQKETGKRIIRKISFILDDKKYLKDGYVILGLNVEYRQEKMKEKFFCIETICHAIYDIVDDKDDLSRFRDLVEEETINPATEFILMLGIYKMLLNGSDPKAITSIKNIEDLY